MKVNGVDISVVCDNGAVCVLPDSVLNDEAM